MGIELDEINVVIAEKDVAYKAHLMTLPALVGDRSEEQVNKTTDLYNEYEMLCKKRDVIRKSEEQDLNFRARSAEFSESSQRSGAEVTRAAPSGLNPEVADKAVYANPDMGLGKQLQDIAVQRRGAIDGIPSEYIQRACRRLEKCENRRIHLMERAADPATQMEKIPSLGGVHLEIERSSDALELGYANSALASKCMRRRMSALTGRQEIYGLKGNLSRKDGERNGNVKWLPIDELKEAIRSQVKYENKLTIQTTKMAAGYNASKEIVRDASFLTGEINNLFMNELPFSIQSYIWEGNGGKDPMVGVKNAKAAYIQPKFGTQAAGTVVWENIIAMYMHMYGGGYRDAFWARTKWIEDQLIALQIPTGDSAELVRAYVKGTTPEMPSILYGHECVTIEQADVPGTIGDIAFLDMSKYILTDKGSMTAASSVEVEFWSDQWAFMFTIEIDGQSLVIDQMDPYKSPEISPGIHEKESPFIFLGTRL